MSGGKNEKASFYNRPRSGFRSPSAQDQGPLGRIFLAIVPGWTSNGKDN